MNFAPSSSLRSRIHRPTDQQSGALVALGEGLGLRQAAHTQRRGHDRIVLVGEVTEDSLNAIKVIGFIEPFIGFSN